MIGLYLLRMISKENLNRKFPQMQFGKFVLAAIVRLGMVSPVDVYRLFIRMNY